MSDHDRKPDSQTPEEVARALAALRRVRPSPVPDDVRERVRQVFLSGRRPGEPLPIPATAAGPSGGAGRWARLAGIAATLLAVLALLATWGLGPAAVWHVTGAVAPEGIGLPGRPPGSEGAALAARIRPGVVRVGASSELELALGSSLRLRLLPDSRVRIPSLRALQWPRERVLRVEQGELFGASYGSLGFRLRLSTPEAEAVLTGTSFAVIRTGDATCFCLYRGRLEITERKGRTAIPLPVEHRVFVYRDGRPARIEPITDRERMKLSMMDAAGPPTSGR